MVYNHMNRYIYALSPASTPPHMSAVSTTPPFNGKPSPVTTTNNHESPAIKFLIGGGVAWTFELIIGHYLEVLKIAKQTSPDGYVQLTKNLMKHKGIMGLLDGYFPWGSIQCFCKGATISFGHTLGYNLLQGRVPEQSAQVIAGGIGGGFQGLVMSPILLLKTRVITDPAFRTAGGSWATTVAATKLGIDVVKKEGFMVLMKGSGTFTTKRVADWATRFFFAEQVTQMVREYKGKENKLTFYEKMGCSLAGGLLSATATIPIDVLVATIQDASKAGQRVGIFETFAEKLRKGGVSGLLKFSTQGYLARCAHVGLTTMLMKTATTAVYEKLNLHGSE